MTTNNYVFEKGTQGALCDVAPTILKVMGVPQPQEMTGRCLVSKK
jgi:2,3-bisphosphoglycerate-independent phosphoglycerate mutase